MKDPRDLHYFLGIKVIHTPDGILLSQRHYVLNMLYKFGMTDCRSISAPLDKNLKLRPNSEVASNEKRLRQIVESLIYQTITRPDLHYPVSVISQFIQRPTVEHLQCAIHERHEGLRIVVPTRYNRTTSRLYWCWLGQICDRSTVDIRFRVFSWERGCNRE